MKSRGRLVVLVLALVAAPFDSAAASAISPSAGALSNGNGGAGEPAPEVVSIATGLDSACALLADASVACWGYGRLANLGNGTLYNSVIPQLVVLPLPATQVTVGTEHA